jgi:methylthioribose-1-phosphate isomerase
LKTIFWDGGKVLLIDQTKLPDRLEYIECNSLDRIIQAINTMEIRGAPAIGVAAAMALALVAVNSKAKSRISLLEELEEGARRIRKTRPTAWNLFWAVDRIIKKAQGFNGNFESLRELVITEARAIAEEDVAINKTLGMQGAELIEDGDTVGTICNAGWLATAGEYGTALGVVKAAHELGKHISVIALETRPVLQGARLTAWELRQDGIPVRVIVDGAVGYCLSRGMIDKFIVGADRIVAKDGCHVINKVGTYTAAVASRRHNIPFYVAAPLSTFDFTHGIEEVIIEERGPIEVAEVAGRRVLAEGTEVFNPAFDITPPSLVDAIITERGVLLPPFCESLRNII